jgi:NitT/TauT family transport system substrate-binding protein
MKKIVASIAVIILIALAGFSVWYLTDMPTTYSGTPESIIVGAQPLEIATLIYIADDQGFFRGNGLNVAIKDYDTAVNAVHRVENGDVDISVSTEYPIVSEAFKKENISMIGSIDKYQTTYLVSRKDLGISNISDLKGKKIGISRDGIGEFYLGRFLDLHGMSLQDVILVDITPAQLMGALTNGSIDAAMVWSIDPKTIEERLGSNEVIWPAQNEQAAYSVMACRNDWIAGHPEAINRLLRSIGQAEEYTINNPAKAKAIVQNRTHSNDAHMASIWPQHQYSLSLDQSLLTAMEDEGRWMIANNLTSEKTLPDYSDYIYTKGLEAVIPESVNIR